MDPVKNVMQNIAEKLDFLVSEIILDFVEEHHVNLGREKWKENITKVNKEYYSTFWLENLRNITRHNQNPKDYPVQLVMLINKKGCSRYPHYNCFHRRFNYRMMYRSDYNTLERRAEYSLKGEHCPHITISNVMKIKSTFHLVSQNYYHARLYVD